MKKSLLAFALFISTLTTFAQSNDVVDIAISSKDHTTLVAAVKAADLVATLKSAGPFTVFAPTNTAFGNLPKGTLETLLKPESKATLAGILAYHVIAGNLDATAVVEAIKNQNLRLSASKIKDDQLVQTITLDDVATFTFDKDKLNLFVRRGIGFGK